MAAWDITKLDEKTFPLTGKHAFSVCRIDNTHALLCWLETTGTYAQVAEIAAGTGVVTLLGSPTTISASATLGTLKATTVCMVDATHAFAAYTGVAGVGGCRVLSINTGTWAVSTVGAELMRDAERAVQAYAYSASRVVLVRIDSSQWTQLDLIGFDGSWNSSQIDNGLVTTTTGQHAAVCALDTGHGVVARSEGASADGHARCFSVSASAVSLLATSFVFEISNCTRVCLSRIDDTHALVSYRGSGGPSGVCVVLVASGAWQLSEPAAAISFDASSAVDGISASVLDANHHLLCYAGADGDGWSRVIEIDLATWALSKPGAAYEWNAVGGTEAGSALIDASSAIVAVAYREFGSTSRMASLDVEEVDPATDCGISTVVQTGVRVVRVTFVASPAGPQIPVQASAETEANWLASGDAGPLVLVTATRIGDLVYDLTFDRDIESGETITVDSSAVATNSGGLCDDPGAGGFVSVWGGIASATLDDAETLRITYIDGGANTAPLEADALNVAKVVVAGALGGMTAVSIVKASAFVYLATLTRPTVVGEACTVDASACATVGGGEVDAPGDLAFVGVQWAHGVALLAEALSPTEIRVTFDDETWLSWPSLGSAGQAASWTVRPKGGSTSLVVASVRMESRYVYVLTLAAPMAVRPYEVVTDAVLTAHGGTCA